MSSSSWRRIRARKYGALGSSVTFSPRRCVNVANAGRDELSATKELGKLQTSQLESTMSMIKEENLRLHELTGELQSSLDLVTERSVELEHENQHKQVCGALTLYTAAPGH